MNVFWSIYGNCKEQLDTHEGCFGDNPAWAEWDALKFSWNNDNGYQDHGKAMLFQFPINGINQTKGEMPNGFLWSWLDSERWPDQQAAHKRIGSFHFDQLVRFPIAVYQYFVWSGDRTFLDNIYSRLDLLMNYTLHEINGSSGIPVNKFNVGLPNTSRPSTYMDQIRSGWKDAWIAAMFYTSLTNLIDLETLLGHGDKAKYYQSVREKLVDQFDCAFWNEDRGRYAGWIDQKGRQHDSGYVYINLEILARGLGNQSRAERIFHWLAQPADPIAIGPHYGSTDAYHNIVGIRSNTDAIPLGDWDNWSDPMDGRRPYGGQVENGGTMIWVSYYDVMARLRYASVDRAWDLFERTVQRVDNDSFCLTFNHDKGRDKDDFGEDLVQIGSNSPFPESGIFLLSFLHGFVGVTPDTKGLNICPKLPSKVTFLQVMVNYLRTPLTIRVSQVNATSNYQLTIPEKQLIVNLSRNHCYSLSSDFVLSLNV